MLTNNILLAFGLTLLAGLSTGIGGAISFFSKKLSPKFLSGSLGFSAGVMIYVSFVELFANAQSTLSDYYNNHLGYLITMTAFFIGIATIALIDWLVPSFENPHEIKNINLDNPDQIINAKEKKLMRLGLFSALVLTIHNFPEGLVTFIGTLSEPVLGISLAVAIAIHNIPEGIIVSIPIYYACKNKTKAFLLSTLSGLTEPLGALLGYFILRSVLNDLFLGVAFAGVAGIMVYISLDELLPTAEEYGQHHFAIGGLVIGMLIMALSLSIF
ncbi:MAG: zinc transporter ZupT [Patescibacteria group bacterium]|nr:zinc transporter ZupT [Patescibacteria group bacterium]